MIFHILYKSRTYSLNDLSIIKNRVLSKTLNKGKPMKLQILSIVLGFVIPSVITMALPRSGTIKFGIWLYRGLGTLLGQKRATQIGIPPTALHNLLMVIRTTFTDLSFGVYIASREDFTPEVRQQKIDEYMKMHLKLQDKENDKSS